MTGALRPRHGGGIALVSTALLSGLHLLAPFAAGVSAPPSIDGMPPHLLPADTPQVDTLPDPVHGNTDRVPGPEAGELPPGLPGAWTEENGLWINREARAISLTASVQADAFMASLPPDHQYHGLVNVDGGAASKALFVTEVDDLEIARVLRELGAQDGGGVPMSAWNLRWVPLVPQPGSRVQGSPIEVTIHWQGAERHFSLEELVEDSGGEGVELRFGGNEEHSHHWESGCILCFFSCPGGVVSNAAYTIRDHQRGATTFDAGTRLPPDGTRIQITFVVGPG